MIHWLLSLKRLCHDMRRDLFQFILMQKILHKFAVVMLVHQPHDVERKCVVRESFFDWRCICSYAKIAKCKCTAEGQMHHKTYTLRQHSLGASIRACMHTQIHHKTGGALACTPAPFSHMSKTNNPRVHFSPLACTYT